MESKVIYLSYSKFQYKINLENEQYHSNGTVHIIEK